jgi:hypothetical protein
MLSEVVYRLEEGKLLGGMFDFAFIHKLHQCGDECTVNCTSAVHFPALHAKYYVNLLASEFYI